MSQNAHLYHFGIRLSWRTSHRAPPFLFVLQDNYEIIKVHFSVSKSRKGILLLICQS